MFILVSRLEKGMWAKLGSQNLADKLKILTDSKTIGGAVTSLTPLGSVQDFKHWSKQVYFHEMLSPCFPGQGTKTIS